MTLSVIRKELSAGIPGRILIGFHNARLEQGAGGCATASTCGETCKIPDASLVNTMRRLHG